MNTIYLVGGAPRSGKSILGQQVAARLSIGWVSTDLLLDLLRQKNDTGVKTSWNATPKAIMANAVWFFPYLERFVWGISSQADSYLIEGVDFLPGQVVQLSNQYEINSVFLGCSIMLLESFDQFLGRSRGYGNLPEAKRRLIVRDVPLWSKFIQQECERFNCSYIDTTGDFHQRLHEADVLLTSRG